MIRNQLFKLIPSKEYVENFIKLLGLSGFEEHYSFSLIDLKKKNVLAKINDELPNLRKYYINCKAKIYLVDLTYKRLITIVRQLIRLYGYRLIGFEKYCKGQKYITYKIEKDVVIEPQEYGLIMNFD